MFKDIKYNNIKFFPLHPKVKKIIFVFLFLFNLVLSHTFPFLTFCFNFVCIIVLHFRKNYTIRNIMGFFLFVAWPFLFYLYLHCFVHAVIDNNILLAAYEGPYYVTMSLDSADFWLVKFFNISTIKCPILGFQLGSAFFKQFLVENFFCLTVVCDYFNLHLIITVW